MTKLFFKRTKPATTQFVSMSSSLIKLSLIFGILLFTVIGIVSSYVSFQQQKETVASRQLLLAENAARVVEDFVQQKINTLDITSATTGLSAATTTDQKTIITKVLGTDQTLRQAIFIDVAGNKLQAASRLATYKLPTNRITPALLSSIKASHAFTGPVYIDQETSEPLMLIAVPVKDIFGDPKGGLVAEVNLKFMWDVVGKVNAGAGGQVYVVDRQGNLIADSDITRVLAHENLAAKPEVKEFIAGRMDTENNAHLLSRGINGGYVVSSHAPVFQPDWAVVIETPVSVAYAPLFKGIITSLIITIIGLAVVMLGGYYLTRTITRPILKLRDSAKLIGRGDLSARTDLHLQNEIGELAAAFNMMAEQLQSSTQKVQEEHARLSASIDSLYIGFLMTFLGTEAISYNPALPQILSLDDDEEIITLERPLTLELLQKKITGFDLKAVIDSCQNEGKAFGSIEINYGPRVIAISGVPIIGANSTLLGAAILFEDVTENRLMERSKDEFFSIASHELRTPLTSIKGNSSMILEYYKDALSDPQLREMIEDMHESADRLIEIVNDFLDISRLEQGKTSFEYKQVMLEKLIESVTYEMKTVLNEKKIYLKLDKLTLNELPNVWADENRLKQVIYNIVGNAAKFTEVGGITISAKVEGELVRVSISDTGRGMTSESQQLLFHKFQQASSSLLTRDTTRGTGLGLYISKIITESMGGTIRLDESAEGKGSTFSFTVPIFSETAASSTDKVTKLDTVSGLTVPINDEVTPDPQSGS